VNEFIGDVQKELTAKLKASGKVGDVKAVNTGNNLDIPQQLQQMQTMIRERPDLIITAPLQPEAFKPVIQQAGKAGIPVVTFLGAVDSPYAINIDANSYLAAATTTSVLARSVGQKGDVITIQGYPGTTVNNDALRGVSDVVKGCPNMKLAGTAIGAFVNGTAKGEVTKLLATHPAPIAGAVEVGGMAPGVIQAFQSVGRPVPVIADIGASKGSLAYWKQHRPAYHGVGTGQSAPASADAVADVALRVLDGQEPKVNSLIP